jgi:hypothetical protein
VALLVPTHESHLVRGASNPGLPTSTFTVERRERVWSDFYNLRLQAFFRPASRARRSPQAMSWASKANPDKQVEEYAYSVVEQAEAAGMALYVGTSNRLEKVTLPARSLDEAPWTGNRTFEATEEGGLMPMDRTIIATLLRAHAGDVNAFCEAKPEDVFLPQFSPAIRSLIRKLPEALKTSDPGAEAMQTAGRGYLNDEDLYTFLDLVRDEVNYFHGHFMHRKNLDCVMHGWDDSSRNKVGAEGMAQPELRFGKAVKAIEDGGRARSFIAASPIMGQQIRYGEQATHLGCTNIALITIRDQKVEATQCDRVRQR